MCLIFAAAIQNEHMCARRPLTRTHVGTGDSKSCACERRGLLRVRRTEGRTDRGRETSLALASLCSFTRRERQEEEGGREEGRGGGGRAAEGTPGTTSAQRGSCQIDFYFALLVFLRCAIITLTCLLARGRSKKNKTNKSEKERQGG